MEIRVLRYFLAVAQEKNITKAAQKLHLTQPTLSRQLMQLEDELGVKLLDRNRYNVTLTKDGLLLKRRAQEIVSLADKTVDDFISNNEELSGEITIGAGEFLSNDYLCELIKEFHNQHSYIRYDIVSDNTEEIEEQLEKGSFDFGVLTETVNTSKYDYIRIPQKETWGILCKKDSELGRKDRIELSDLKNMSLILPRRIKQNANIDYWFKNLLDQYDIVATYNLLYNAAMMVKKEIGVALCLQLGVSYRDLCFVPLSPSVNAYSLLVWKRNQVYSPIMAAFIDFAKKYNKKL